MVTGPVVHQHNHAVSQKQKRHAQRYTHNRDELEGKVDLCGAFWRKTVDVDVKKGEFDEEPIE
jgi:hypothetical protein